jgi:hypothetical protein
MMSLHQVWGLHPVNISGMEDYWSRAVRRSWEVLLCPASIPLVNLFRTPRTLKDCRSNFLMPRGSTIGKVDIQISTKAVPLNTCLDIMVEVAGERGLDAGANRNRSAFVMRTFAAWPHKKFAASMHGMMRNGKRPMELQRN